jgi:4-amino-4-deoxy-L-arabinose transferase-like glycosyltransferase
MNSNVRFPVPVLCAGIVVMLWAYWSGLNGLHIPKIGDEFVYANIARLTAASEAWLPLQSAFEAMRNTKPPLLFWQAMVAGDWGEAWTLQRLRAPSVLYTMAITALIIALGARLAAQRRLPGLATGLLAGLVYLIFFSTYRYGRPYLTSAPETFWMLAIFAAIAWNPRAVLGSRVVAPVMFGVAAGLLCMYKTFAMVVPLGLGLALCYQVVGARAAPWQLSRPGIVTDGLKISLALGIALLIFGLWFALDPDPGAIWREFVVGENAGKFNSQRGYLASMLWGDYSIWGMLVAYPVNTGLLLFVAVGALWVWWKERYRLSDGEQVLLLWAAALLLVFLAPNQRSGRYVLPAMPVIAIGIALHASKIHRALWSLSALASLIGLGVIMSIGWGITKTLTAQPGSSAPYSIAFWMLLGVSMLLVALSLAKAHWVRPGSLLGSACLLITLGMLIAPMDRAQGRFDSTVIGMVRGQTVASPSNFNGQFERYEFLLPGAKIQPYKAPQPIETSAQEIQQLLDTHAYVLVQRKVGEPPCERCTIIAQRWDVRSRHTRNETIRTAFTSPQTFWLAREYLVSKAQ